MTLTTALNAARSSLATSAGQTALVSRNVANAANAGAARKSAKLLTLASGGVYIASIARASNDAMWLAKLDAVAKDSASTEMVSALGELNVTVGDTSDEHSPAALIGKLDEALQRFSASPQSTATAQSAVSAARDVAGALSGASAATQDLRSRSDAAMAASVETINQQLARFGALNNEIVRGTQAGRDVTDALDQRDEVLVAIAAEIGIKTIGRGNNDVAIYTDSGVTLFETKARSVGFEPTPALGAGRTGASVFVDGVPVTGRGVAMGVEGGRIAGLARIRDEVTVTYQAQIDETARGLIEAFAEQDQSGSGSPARTGLFTYAGAPDVPASGRLIAGIAATLKVAARVDPQQGGDAIRLRDGGISSPDDPAYRYNATGDAGYTARLQDLQSSLSAQRSFDAQAQGPTEATVSGYATTSVAWLSGQRQQAQSAADYAGVVKERATSALSNDVGVNVDAEMASMLELERSYQATAKVISTIDGMFGALLGAIG